MVLNQNILEIEEDTFKYTFALLVFLRKIFVYLTNKNLRTKVK